jgi:uncharacterized protein (TIGR02217 family)
MAFLEVEFPTTISYKAVGGPGFSTNVNQGFSGGEQRNQNWKFPRGKWTVSLTSPAGTDRQQFIDLLYAFFDNAKGKLNAFRLKDHKSFQATAQPLALNADGNVQLAITRTVGGFSFVQFISKPITADVVDYKGNALGNTVQLTSGGGGVTVDHTTGLVTSAGPGTLVDFQYHYPVRFDTDELMMMAEAPTNDGLVVSWDSIPLIEVLAPDF